METMSPAITSVSPKDVAFTDRSSTLQPVLRSGRESRVPAAIEVVELCWRELESAGQCPLFLNGATSLIGPNEILPLFCGREPGRTRDLRHQLFLTPARGLSRVLSWSQTNPCGGDSYPAPPRVISPSPLRPPEARGSSSRDSDRAKDEGASRECHWQTPAKQAIPSKNDEGERTTDEEDDKCGRDPAATSRRHAEDSSCMDLILVCAELEASQDRGAVEDGKDNKQDFHPQRHPYPAFLTPVIGCDPAEGHRKAHKPQNPSECSHLPSRLDPARYRGASWREPGWLARTACGRSTDARCLSSLGGGRR